MDTSVSRARQVGRRPGPRALRLASTLLLAGALTAFPRDARSDAAVAQVLIEQGKKAIDARDYATATHRLGRAREEDPAQIEAAYLLGTVYEKTKEPGKALSAYRAFRDAAAEQVRAGTLDKRLPPLVKKAEERIAALGKGEAELDALQAGFAQKVLEVARRLQQEDPDLARYALTKLLEVLPGQPDAQKLLDALGGTTKAASSAEAPIPGITQWTDLLVSQAIPPSDRVVYADGVLTIEQAGGSVFWTGSNLRAEEPAVLEIEFRCTQELATGWLVGLTFGRGEPDGPKADTFVNVFAQATKVIAVQVTGGRPVDLGTTVIPPLGDGWHRLAVGLEQGKVRIFLDGKKLSSASVPGRDSLDGGIGVFHQRCRAEIRTLRMGSAK